MATIYISSDPTEFGSYREVLRERLRDHGHEAKTRDELEESGKATLLQRIDDGILKSEVVICLMGERYGPEPPEKEREARAGERRSYTQWEYVLAKRYEKPVHVFYADDDAPLDVPNDEGKDLTKLQEVFLAEEVVAKGVPCKAFRDQPDLVAQILQLEPAWPRRKDASQQRNPYVGLRRFEEKDRDRFFGRENLVQHVLDRLENQRLTALVGQSGAGKSSLVRAGVIPAWRKKHPEGKVILFQPDRDPFASLASALTLAGFDAGRVKLASEPSELVFRDLRRGSSRVNDPLGLRSKPATEPWLIFVDQFEEICTLAGQSLDDQECIRRFVASLEDAVGMGDEGISIILALRDDFFGCLGSHPGLYPLVDAHLTRVSMPDGRDLRTMIEAPARAQGARLEDGLVTALLTDMEESGGGLPLLQDALASLWEAETKTGLDSGVLKSETYQKLGGLRGILPGRMAQYLESKGPEELRVVENLLMALIGIQSFGGAVQTYSRRLPQSELLEKGGRGSQELLRELVSQVRVLVTSEDANPFDPVVELGHEALIRGWDRLDRWVADVREALEIRDQMTQSAQSWERLRSGPNANPREAKAVLWRGGRLARAMECNEVGSAAKQSLFERIGGLDLLEQDFLKASYQRVTRVRKWAGRLAVASCVAALAGSGAWVFLARQALAAREQVRNTELESKLSAAQAESALGWLGRSKLAKASPDAGLYAARAVGFEGAGRRENGGAGGDFPRLLPANEWGQARASEALRLIGEASLPFFWSAPFVAEPGKGGRDSTGAAVAWSPDGKWLVTGGPAPVAVLWNAQGGELVKKLEGHEGAVSSLAFSPDGAMLASGGTDKTVRLWKMPGGEPAAKLTGHGGWVGAMAFGPDGKRLATGGYDDTVRIWDTGDGKEKKVLKASDLGFVYSVAFSPDGRVLAASGEHELIQLWDAETGSPRQALKGHTSSVNSLAFHPAGHLLASASSDQSVRLWDVSKGIETASLAGHGGGLSCLAWNSGGNLLASGGADRIIRIWDVEKRSETVLLTGHASEVTSLAWDPGSTHVLSGGRAGDVKLWAAHRWSSEARDLMSYVEGGWVEFDSQTGDLVWKLQTGGFPYEQKFIDPESWVGILRGLEDGPVKADRLFRMAMAARAWNSAMLLARDLTPDQRQQKDELTNAAAQALVAEAKEAPTPELARIRIEQGRALVSGADAWKEFDSDPAVPVEALVAKVKPPKVEPKAPVLLAAAGEGEAPPGMAAPQTGADLASAAVPGEIPGPNVEVPGGGAANPEGSPAPLKASVIAPAAPAAPLVHVVQPGDNPFTIAKKYGITQDKLMEFNKIKDPRRLQIGAELKIPPGGEPQPAEEPVKAPPEPEDPSFTYHTVRAGESPNSISRKYHVAELDLMELNRIDDPSKLQIGARLKIPKNTLKSKRPRS